ncbi:Mis12-domain-containing protein [Auriscalpium vulgare]|uniref:Mis12-domain-containing protein n=1 Tax=Auriscalpium vulgare TaxID=40419 RepID=A0ACB8S6V7_9AGAM|nr:Mis12-domain-containing protein [Auriscalpium vulgare]
MPQPPAPDALLHEILTFSHHFLLDDLINIANETVGQAVDAMHGFLERWGEQRKKADAGWDGTPEVEKGLVAFQTLLERHTDLAFDRFELWSRRNIFTVSADLAVVAPHHEGLDLEQPPEKEAELLAEIVELQRKISNQRRLQRLYTRAIRVSTHQAHTSEKRLERLSFLQSPPSETLSALPANVDAVYKSVSLLPEMDLSRADVPLPDPGKRQWETGKAGYVSWAIAQLISRAKRLEAQEGASGASVDVKVEDAYELGSTEDVKDALAAVAGE